MERHHSTSQGCQPQPGREGALSDTHTLNILQSYADGHISAREAAQQIGPNATEHDVFAGILAAHLSLPSPTASEIARDVAALHALYGPHEPRKQAVLF